MGDEMWGHGTAVIADYQSRGRGRQGRGWVAPPRTSLLMSVALLWPDVAALSRAVMLAAVAVSDAIEDETGLRTDIKWPNDLHFGERKVCGILSETIRKGDDQFVILGIGINVNFDPSLEPGTGNVATSLCLETGSAINRETLAIAVFAHLDLWYRILTETPETVHSTWSARLSTLGHLVTVTAAAQTWDGTAIGVEPDGGLLVRATDGITRTVYAADVSVRVVGNDPLRPECQIANLFTDELNWDTSGEWPHRRTRKNAPENDHQEDSVEQPP